jgi:hypothetical protein
MPSCSTRRRSPRRSGRSPRTDHLVGRRPIGRPDRLASDRAGPNARPARLSGPGIAGPSWRRGKGSTCRDEAPRTETKPAGCSAADRRRSVDDSCLAAGIPRARSQRGDFRRARPAWRTFSRACQEPSRRPPSVLGTRDEARQARNIACQSSTTLGRDCPGPEVMPPGSPQEVGSRSAVGGRWSPVGGRREPRASPHRDRHPAPPHAGRPRIGQTSGDARGRQ